MPALARGSRFFVSEAIVALLHICLLAMGLQVLGIEGAAVAYAVMYAGYIAVVYLIARQLVGSCWTRTAMTLQWLIIVSCVALLIVNRALEHGPALVAGMVCSILMTLFSLLGGDWSEGMVYREQDH